MTLKNTLKTQHDIKKEITIIAHRGNSAEAPENTLAAFNSAAMHNIPFIECDVHLTKDHVPVVIHDRILSRTTNYHFTLPIEKLTLKEVKSLDCGKWFAPAFLGEKILTLVELLNAPLKNIGLMVEIKEGSAPDNILVDAVMKIIMQHPRNEITRPIIIGSISPNIVKLVKQYSHKLTIGIVEEHSELFHHLSIDPDLIAPFKELVTLDLVRQMHDLGKKVWVWTIDTPEELARIKACNADGVISNRPKIIKSLS